MEGKSERRRKIEEKEERVDGREERKKKKLKHEQFIAYQARRHVFNVENSLANERGASRRLLIKADSRWTASTKFQCSEKARFHVGQPGCRTFNDASLAEYFNFVRKLPSNADTTLFHSFPLTLVLFLSLSLSLSSYFTFPFFPYRVPRELRRLFAIQIDPLAIFRWKPICTCSLFILRHFASILNPYACRFVSNYAAFFAYFSFIVISHLS